MSCFGQTCDQTITGKGESKVEPRLIFVVIFLGLRMPERETPQPALPYRVAHEVLFAQFCSCPSPIILS